MIHTSTLPDVDIPQDVSITDFTLRKAAQLADQPAIIDGPSGRTVTFKAVSYTHLTLPTNREV